METKIYIVESSEGAYEDYHSWIEKAFRNKDAAEAYAKEIDAKHFLKPVVEEKLWEDAENFWYYTNEQQYGVNWERCPYDWKTEREKCELFNKEQDEKERKFLLDYVNAHSNNQYTLNDIIRHQEYEDNSCYDWHPCSVSEIALIE